MSESNQHRVSRSARSSKAGKKRSAFAATFLIMAVFWIMFSGKFDLFHLSIGGISCLIVASLSSDLLFPRGIDRRFGGTSLRFAGYIPWLLLQIFLANLRVLRLTFHPRMIELIDPHIIQFDSTLKGDMARTTFANSITLTPGTITVSVNALGRFSVHCIDKVSAEPLPGEMQQRIESVFKEP